MECPTSRWFHDRDAWVERALMTDDEVLAAVAELVSNRPNRAVTAGEVAAHVATWDVDEVTMHLEQLREADRLFRAVGTESDHPPAVVTYTLYE
jgi:hypothetical protein